MILRFSSDNFIKLHCLMLCCTVSYYAADEIVEDAVHVSDFAFNNDTMSTPRNPESS